VLIVPTDLCCLDFLGIDVRHATSSASNNRQTRDGRLRKTVGRRRTALISRRGKFSYDIDRTAGCLHLRISGSIQQLLADLRHNRFAVQRRHLIVIPTPECLLPAGTHYSGYLHSSDIAPVTPCQHTKQPGLVIADSVHSPTVIPDPAAPASRRTSG
jgi:hypothetical protein